MQGGFFFRSTAAQGDARNARKTALFFRSRQRAIDHATVMAWDQAASNGPERAQGAVHNTCVMRLPKRPALKEAWILGILCLLLQRSRFG
jgi:hypothetical protein